MGGRRVALPYLLWLGFKVRMRLPEFRWLEFVLDRLLSRESAGVLDVDVGANMGQTLLSLYAVRPNAHRKVELMNLLQGIDYEVWQIRKHDRRRGVEGLTKTDRFPQDVWTRELAELCDFLSLPSERAADLIERLR
jgi:hypothetical protein